MTEARGYLQKAPREGAADLVACASVTTSSLSAGRVFLCRSTDLWPSSTPWNGGKSLVGIKRARIRRECLVAASSDLEDTKGPSF